MSYSKKTCVHCFTDMPSPAMICPHCRYSQLISYQDIVQNQRPSKNNNFNTQNNSSSGTGCFTLIGGIALSLFFFWLLNLFLGNPFF